ncbi:MAG: CCA tRNA nucleotidyltransferase [Acidobacteria bacterium]|nr:CCA tRNA nucleotidyltransferase [Acidobacteriota bacterium]
MTSKQPQPTPAQTHPTPSPARAAAETVAAKLGEGGFQAYFVGGCVRDLLRGVEPQDWDIATDACPADVLILFPHSLMVGAQFGVVGVIIGKDLVEVATFRNDGLYSDGRRPDAVSYTRNPREDVLRRDFTINGLLLHPASGEVLDFVEGKNDIERRVVRAIGSPERRFAEDRLRMLRAIRFAAVLGYEIDGSTFAAVQHRSHEITEVSAERVRDELLRILTGGQARRGMELLDSSGLLKHILPGVSAMKGVAQPPEFHPEGDVWTHTLLMLEMLEKDCSETLAVGVLLHDVGKPPTFRVATDRIRFDNHVTVGMRMAEEICRRLHLSHDQIVQVASLVENHLRFKDVPQMRPSTLKRFLRLEKFEEHMELHRLDCLSSHRNLDNYEYVREKMQELPEAAIRPARLITGNDLIAMGLAPGPRFAEILHAVEDAQLEGQLHSREQALEWARRFVE